MAWGSSPVAHGSIAQIGGGGDTLNLSTTGADTLIAFVWGGSSHNLTDSQSNTWIAPTGSPISIFGGSIYLHTLYAKNASVSASHDFTVGSGVEAFTVSAWTGGHLTAPFDAYSASGDAFLSTNAPGSITPTAGALVLTASFFRDPGASQDGGFTEIDADGGFAENACEQAYLSGASGSAINLTWTHSSSTFSGASILSLLPAGGGSSPQTLTPSAVVASWSVPSPTLVTPVTLSVGAVTASWTTPSSTLTANRTLSVSAVAATWNVPASTVVPGAVTLSAEAAFASWTVPSASLGGTQTLTPAAIAATWSVPTPTVVPGAATISASAASASWSVPAATLVPGTATLVVTPVSASWIAVPVTLVGGEASAPTEIIFVFGPKKFTRKS
jgi:hypothetical protein